MFLILRCCVRDVLTVRSLSRCRMSRAGKRYLKCMRARRPLPKMWILPFWPGTPGTSGADIENLINEAVLNARSNKDKVNMHDFEFAKDKILGSKERAWSSATRKSAILYHEVGHTWWRADSGNRSDSQGDHYSRQSSGPDPAVAD